MNNSNFCHLHCHNEFSYLDGYGNAEQWVSRAKKMGFMHLALTNHGDISGCLKFQKECDKQGIEPVLGAELYVVPNARDKSNKKEQRGHMTVLVKNEVGWKSLLKCITYSHLEGFYYKPRVDFDTILSCDLSGWVVMSGCTGSFLNLDGSMTLMSEFGDRGIDFYYEIMPNDHPKQIKYNKRFAEQKDFLVATHDCHYIMAEDEEVQQMLLCVQTNKKWTDPRWFDFKELYLKSADEMVEAFEKQGQFSRKQYLQAMRNTVKIAKMCSGFRIPKKKVSLPVPEIKAKKISLPIPIVESKGRKEDEILYSLCDPKKVPLTEEGEWPYEYWDRFQRELELIRKKKFTRYFLIVWDLIQWCKENNIMVGPCRGSAGGSLVSYLMGITQVDPIKHGLSFSRFISEDRIDLPDIDIDFEKRKRWKVKKYLEETYGKYSVAGISTFSHMAGRGAIRDVGRVLELPDKEIDYFAKSIPYGEEEGIAKACEESETCSIFADKYPEAIDFAIRLDGQIRGQSQHAAAVVISAEDLRDGQRCSLRIGKEKELLICWDMDDCEHVGLLKLDILGLSTLSVLSEASILLIKPIDFYNTIPLDDPKVYDLINRGETTGIFQLSGHASSLVIKDMEVKQFEDIVAIMAIARPGPAKSGMTAEFLERKEGKQWKKNHPIYEGIAKDTYGILIYQEQITQVISRVAGMAASDADRVRKIISKKRDPKLFKKYEKEFAKGCEKNGTMTAQQAKKFWEELQEWAGYGFNRSHSVGYALITYWTAWLKVYHPAEFYCAYLTYGDFFKDSLDKNKQRVIDEALEKGFKIMPPKLGRSDMMRWTLDEKVLYVPFTEIKGVGEAKIKQHFSKKKTKKSVQKGFFDVSEAKKNMTQVEKVLEEIGANDPDAFPDNIDKYFEFSFGGADPYALYPNLMNLLGFGCDMKTLKSVLSLDVKFVDGWLPDGVIQRKRYHINKVVECERCELTNECRSPVVTSTGIYNVFIVGEAGGKDEDRERKGFVGAAGKKLWKEVKRYGYQRRDFHVSNICHCYPKITKTPKEEHIKACLPWLQRELKQSQCHLILALGNIPLFALSGRKAGITDLSGTTEWIDSLGAWVCWGMHPAATLHRKGNDGYFELGVKNFIEKFELLKGDK
jgi:DNA polymerase-3 subunit alpha